MATNQVPHTIQETSTSYADLETRYVRMIVEADEIAWEFNVLASSANWVLLAGYLVIPGTFTSLQKSDAVGNSLPDNAATTVILSTIQNPPLLGISCFLFLLGTAVLGWLFWEHKVNYIWLINRLLIPTLLNALAGLLTTIINIFTARQGDVSIMALLTVIASSISASSALGLVVIYKKRLKKLREEHWHHTEFRGSERHSTI